MCFNFELFRKQNYRRISQELARNTFSYNEREFPFANDDLKEARNVSELKVSISIRKHPILVA